MQVEKIGVAAAGPAAAQLPDKLEQAFLEEMLKYCGPSARQGEFSGGIGEEQFNSFLAREYAARLSQRMDLGFSAALSEGRS